MEIDPLYLLGSLTVLGYLFLTIWKRREKRKLQDRVNRSIEAGMSAFPKPNARRGKLLLLLVILFLAFLVGLKVFS